MSVSFSHPSHHLADGTVRLFLAEALILPTGFVTTVYLTRVLGPQGYGLFTLAITVFTWVAFTTTSLFSRATIKCVSEADDWRPVAVTVLRLYLVCGSGAALLLWGAAHPIAMLLDEPKLKTYLQLFSIEVLIFSLVEAHRGIVIGAGLFRKRALASVVRWPVRLVLIVLFVEMGLAVSGAVLGSIGATLIELAMYRLWVRPSLFSSSSFSTKKLWISAPSLSFSALCMHVFMSVDVFALKALGGSATDTGIYGAAQNLALLPALFSASFSPLLLATLSRLLQTGRAETARQMGVDAMRLVIGMLPFVAMTMGMADDITVFLFGPAFAPTAPLLTLLLFGRIALVMMAITTALIIAADRPGWTFALNGPVLLLAIPAHVLLIPRLGSVGAASVTAGCAGMGALASLCVVYWLWRVFPPLDTIGRSILVSGLAYAIAVLWPMSGFWVILKLLAIITLIAFGFGLLGEFRTRERAFLWSFFSVRFLGDTTTKITAKHRTTDQ